MTPQELLAHRVQESENNRSVTEIRPLTRADLQAVLRLESTIYPEALQALDAEDWEEYDGPDNLSLILMEKNARGDRPIGYAIAYVAESEQYADEDAVYVEDVAVLPAIDGRGYGARLFAAVAQAARERGLPIECHARESTSYPLFARGRRFLEQLGYTMITDQRMEDYYEDDQEQARFLRFELAQNVASGQRMNSDHASNAWLTPGN